MGAEFVIPETALGRHIAALGETGSGKTHDTKVIVEHVVAQGYRVCVLDTIKSDWWGITSSANGKRPGLPFKILGGPRGHVPLHAGAGKAIGQLVGEGKLPLSIIDMADFDMGGPQKFFVDFAQALWKSIRGVVYLVIEEAHELAPKERAGFGSENMAVHWAKKLATGSRTKGIRLIIASQRTQAVHNALLGSCGTLIAHSLSLPADQKPIIDWLNANVRDKSVRSSIVDDLAFLPTGTAWVCCAKDNFFKKIHFPKISTFDNSATPDKDTDEFDVATAPVDPDELRSIIGDAVKEAEANDPKALKAELVKANAELAKLRISASQPSKAGEKIIVDETAALRDRERAFAAGVKQGAETAWPEGWLAGEKTGFTRGVAAHHAELKAAMGTAAPVAYVAGTPPKAPQTTYVSADAKVVPHRHGEYKPVAPVAQRIEHRNSTPKAAGSNPAGRANIPGPQLRILDSLATWHGMGHYAPSNAQVAWLARYSPTSTSYTNPRGALKSAELIDYPAPDRLRMTVAGNDLAIALEIPGSLFDYVLAQLPGPEARILRAAAAFFPASGTNDQVAQGADYSASSTSYTNPRGALKTKDLITYPGAGQVRAAEWLFPEAT